MSYPEQPGNPGSPQQAQPPAYGQPPTPGYGQPPAAPYGQPQGYGQPGGGPVGTVRGTGMVILLAIVTFGIYSVVWYVKSFGEMKRHNDTGPGAGIVWLLLIPLVGGLILVFMLPGAVGDLYRKRGQQPPVGSGTGAWVFLPFAGGIIWLVKTNGALNSYWRSLGAH